MARPIAQDHDDKRQAILRAAARLFADEGYGRASMSGVAAACGISKANIYHYYDSKETLLFDILDTHLRGLRDHICGLNYLNDDPAKQLRIMLREVLLAYQGADAEHDVLLSTARTLPDDQQDVLREYQRELIEVCRSRLAQIVTPKVAADREKMWALTMSVFGMLNWHYKWSGDADADTRRAHAQLIADLVIGGLPNV